MPCERRLPRTSPMYAVSLLGVLAMVVTLNVFLDLSSLCSREGIFQVARETKELRLLTAFLDLQ
jgi:hypothetical protein